MTEETLIPTGLQTPEGIERVNKAQSAYLDVTARLAEATDKFFEHITWCGPSEVRFNFEDAREDAEDIILRIEERREAQYELRAAVAGRPPALDGLGEL
jgi:hypothetical protein